MIQLFFFMTNNHFSIKILKKTLLYRFLMTLVTYSDSRRFFQCKISPLFSTVFQNVDGRCLRYATVISHLRLYQFIIDVSFVGSLMIEYFI